MSKYFNRMIILGILIGLAQVIALSTVVNWVLNILRANGVKGL